MILITFPFSAFYTSEIMLSFFSGDQNSIETNHKDSDVPSASNSPDDVTVDDVPVDENLFTEDLDGLEDELDELDI